MFFRICFWFCGIIFDTPTIEKIIFLSSTVAIYSFVCFVGKDNENNSYWQIKTEGQKTECWGVEDIMTKGTGARMCLLKRHNDIMTEGIMTKETGAIMCLLKRHNDKRTESRMTKETRDAMAKD